MLILDVVLYGLLVVLAVAIARTRDLFAAAMLSGIFSLLSAGLFTLLDAVEISAAVVRGSRYFEASAALDDPRVALPVEDAMRYERNLFGVVSATEDMRAGLRAFLDKHPPVYRNR